MMNFTAGGGGGSGGGALKPECLAAFSAEPWKCFMAPHMQRWIRTPFFMQQSKFGACGRRTPPYLPSFKARCTTVYILKIGSHVLL